VSRTCGCLSTILMMSAPTAGFEFCQNSKPHEEHRRSFNDAAVDDPTRRYGLPHTGQ
jgi:hypothetical protein